jgi:hypothetical protein
MLTISRYAECTLTIEGQPVTVLLKRLTIDEAHELMRFVRENAIRGARLNKDANLDTADTSALETALETASAWELRAKKQLATLIDRFVKFAPGTVQDAESQTPIETGADIVRVFGGSRNLMGEFVDALYEANRLSDHEKKVSRSRSDSAAGSPAPTPVPPTGPVPAPTAASAD